MKKIIDKKRGEKGAITLFVLLACLFFVFTLSGVYISNLNKLQAQEKQMKQIQENYARDIDRVEEIHESLARNISVSLTQNPDGIPTKEVELTGKATAKERGEIKEYIFEKDGQEIGEWTKVEEKDEIEEGDNIVVTKDIIVTENGEYEFIVKDEKGEPYSSTITVDNIDNTPPILGALKAQEETEDGWTDVEFDNNNEIRTDKDVKIKVKESEEKNTITTMTIQQNGITKWEDITEKELDQTGIYTIILTTKDEVGNITTNEEKPYIIYIDKIVPILALKHNDENGADYEEGTWTKDDLYGEITIDTTKSGKTVEKYQYSENGIIWDDISDEPVVKELDYTTTFPMSEDKPEWIKGPTNNGDYYFEVQADGTLKPNNSGIHSKIAYSYFEIDLSNFPGASLELTINATISSENNYDFGFAEITTTNTAPTFNKSNTYYIKVSGTTTTANHTKTLTGGQKYYLHIGYSKDSSQNTNQDTFIINSITLKSEELGKGINFNEYTKTDNKVTFKLQEDIEKELYIRAVYTGEDGESKYGEDKTSIKIDKKVPKVENSNVVILSKTEARADIKVKEEGSGIRGYYISTEQTKPTETSIWTEQLVKEFTIEGLNTSTTYYLWIIDKVGNISEKHEIVIGTANYTIDDKESAETLEQAITKATDGSTIKLINDYTDTSTATINKNVTLDIQNYTLTRDKTITVNGSKTVEITGTGKITTGTTSLNTITNSGTLTISNSITIENNSTSSSYAPVRNNTSGTIININDNVNIIGYYRGIYNYYGTININGGIIKATYSNSSAYGIYNSSSSSKIYINNGVIEGYTGIYNSSSSALTEMTGGKLIGTGSYGITGGTVNIYGGRVEGKTYGIYNTSTDKVTIGKQEDELSTTQPAIYGASYGIYMSNETYSFNFYNGVIISNTEETAYRGVMNIRERHMPYTYFDDNIEKKYCTILVPAVENITMEAIPTEYTNGDVTVKITYPYIEGTIRQYSEDKTIWDEAGKYIHEILVNENKTIYARTLNESGVVIDENQIEINNIDKEKPTVTISPSQTNYSVTSSTGTVDLTLTITATDTGVSGLDKMQYAWAEEGEEPTYTDFSNTVTITKTNLGIGQYNLYLNITDKAGNVSDIKQLRYNVKFSDPVAQIGSTKYTTVQAAVNACSKSAGNTQTTIIMLKSTDEEFSTYSGQNIILDLKGYTIGTSNTETPLCTNNAKLTLRDTSTAKTGKLESLNGTAVLNNGTFILGNSSNSIEMEVPTIYGLKKGVENKGTFDFYDGKVQGIIPIDGNVQNTPAEYGPVSTGIVEGITTIQLGIVSGYEARIEWVYYEKLLEAVDIAKNGETVVMLKNIQNEQTVIISKTKDIKIDLNRYELAVIPNITILLQNSGKLEIKDSSTEQTGKMINSSTYTIKNIDDGNLTISGGTIENTSTSSNAYSVYNQTKGNVFITGGKIQGKYGIYNNTGNVNINGGEIGINSTSGSAIYNKNGGNIKIEAGTISNGAATNNGNGIFNEVGTVTVTGGNITLSYNNSNYSYSLTGIYNGSKGKIEFIGGTINVTGIGWAGYLYGIHNNGGYLEFSEGIINAINNKTETTDIYGILNSSYGEVVMKGGEINCQENNISVEANGQDYTDYCIGINNTGSGIVTVEGGKVTATSKNTSPSNNPYAERMGYGIHNESDGTVIIGNKEQTNVTQTPVIVGSSTGSTYYVFGYGIYNERGKFEFYNGQIQGSLLGLAGSITKIRDGHKITETTLNSMNTLYLSKDTSSKQYVAQIDSTQYYTLQDAIDSIGEEEQKTIKIIRSFTVGQPIHFNKNIILNLNGYTVTNKYYQISNTGNLQIIGSSGKITYTETIAGIINKLDGYIDFQSGTITCTSTKNFVRVLYNTGEKGTVKLSGGTVNATSIMFRRDFCAGIYNKGGSNSNIIIESGNINSAEYGIYSVSGGMIKLRGGTIKSSATDHFSVGIGGGTIEMTGGTISCNSTYNGSTGIEEPNSLKMTGGTITCSTSKLENIGISGGKIDIQNATITCSSSSESGYGIYNSGSAIIGNGTTINVSSYSNSYGVYNSNSSSKVTLGVKGDEGISATSPSITASGSSPTYGIYNTSGIFNFYDGKIKGSTKAIYDTITEREDGTELNYQSNQTILTLSTSPIPVAQIGTIKYNTLKSAIDAVGTSQTTIEILRNVAYSINDQTINIPSGKNIVIDLKGNTITSAIPNTLIQNQGTLKLIDTVSGGEIISIVENTIKNSEGANLTISGVSIENRKNNVIYNEGILNIESGTLKVSYQTGNTLSINGIYNAESGNVNITGGTIINYNSTTNDVLAYGIYNAGTGNIQMSGGTIENQTSSYTNRTYGIYNLSTGNVIIESGAIVTYRYGIYNKSTGNITLGIKGDGIISKENPLIIADKKNDIGGYGIYNPNGIFNMYDGIIRGAVRAIFGNVSGIEDLTELEVTNSDSQETVKLKQTTNLATVNNVEYDSIQEAVKACGTTESTIKLLRDSNPGATVIIEQGQNITLDLNGFRTKMYQSLTNNGTLKIVDTSTEQTGETVSVTGIAISNTGDLELEGGSISDSGYGIQNTGTLNITGGNIKNNSYGVYNDGNGIVNVTGGNIKSNTYGIYNYNGTTNITSTGITSNEYGVYVSGGTVNTKEGAEIQSNTGVYVSNGILNIGETGTMNSSSPIIIGEEYGISVAPTGTVYMYDGQVKGKTSSTQGYITYTETGYAVVTKVEGEYMVDYLALAGTISTVAEVNGISFSNLQSAINSVTGEEPQTVKLTNGIISDMAFTVAEGQNVILDMNGKTISSDLEITIKNEGNLTIIDSSGNNVAKISSTTGIAIKNTGTLTLGINDGTVNQELITIDGTTYGIETSGTLNFYDGTINGASAVNGTITIREAGYVIRATTVDGKERYYLST